MLASWAPGFADSATCGPPRRQQVSTLPQAYPQFPSGSPWAAASGRVEMRTDPGKGGAQGQGGVVQVGGPRLGEKAGPIKCSRPQGLCSLVERVRRGLGAGRCSGLQVS